MTENQVKAKKNKTIHPKYGSTKIFTLDKSEITLNSCLILKKEEFHLTIDCTNHPAWNKGKVTKATSGAIENMNRKFAGIQDI